MATELQPASAGLAARTATFLLTAAIAAILFINVCDLVFDCGCRSLWNGAAEECNIHIADARHCPWCERPLVGAGAFLVVLSAQAAAIFAPLSLGIAARFGLAIGALPLAGGLIGWLQGWLMGYWS